MDNFQEYRPVSGKKYHEWCTHTFIPVDLTLSAIVCIKYEEFISIFGFAKSLQFCLQQQQSIPVVRQSPKNCYYRYRSVAKILVRYYCILAVLSVVQESSNREAATEATGLKNQLELFPYHIQSACHSRSSCSDKISFWTTTGSRSGHLEACTLISATKNELRKIVMTNIFVSYVEDDLSETSALSSALPAKSKWVHKISGRQGENLTTTTIGKHNIDSEITTTEDKMWREFYEVLERVLNEFEEHFSIQLPVLEATRCLNPKIQGFYGLRFTSCDRDILWYGRILVGTGGILVDTMQLKCQALIARAFVSQLPQKPVNALDVFESLGGLKEAYSELLKVVSVVLTLPLTTCSNERFLSVLTFVKD